MEFQEFKDSIIEYLKQEKEYCEADIENNKHLSNSEKEEKGLLIQFAKIVEQQGCEYKFSVPINNTKLRPGDKVIIRNQNTKKCFKATIVENDFEYIYLTIPFDLPHEDDYDIEIEEFVLLDPLISLAENVADGAPGAFLFKQLAGIAEPIEEGLGRIPIDRVNTFPETLNNAQYEVCSKSLNRPSIYCIQGPPGTGKTDVLATIAHTFSNQKKEVLIISNTHQAVNNALNKICKRAPELTIVKIGEELKAQELDDRIILAKCYKDYIEERKATKKNKSLYADIVGMTYYGGILNLGLRNSGFKPSIILVDEAGQMPLAEASLIGTFGSGSIIFIGDDKQMPPISHEKLQDHHFSTSIFSFLCVKYPQIKGRLSVTYRMNEEITQCVSRNFYEVDGEHLIASDFSKSRFHSIPSSCNDERIKHLLSDKKSIHQLDVTTTNLWEDINIEEADFIANLVDDAIKNGMNKNDIAIITPYRRQVKAIRSSLNKLDIGTLPLIDTVERLQGQDVDMIIISFCVASPTYFQANKSFLLNPNRLNVMISRAKKKVVLLASDVVKKELLKQYLIEI
ncbi:MAG: AAA family ATPase [Bacteroides sp.]|nr:AAA family ATPase [Bacteroides sp.]